MLTDTALKHLKPKAKPYKVSDRDGMFVLVSPGGTISFRIDYRLHGRRETVTLGKYSPSDLSLARAREKCIDAKRLIAEGHSPAIEKQRDKRRIKEAKSFGQFGEKWLQAAPMADSTRAMRRSIFERELLPVWKSRLLTEISPGDLREHCLKIVDRGAPATAIHVRDIFLSADHLAASKFDKDRPGIEPEILRRLLGVPKKRGIDPGIAEAERLAVDANRTVLQRPDKIFGGVHQLHHVAAMVPLTEPRPSTRSTCRATRTHIPNRFRAAKARCETVREAARARRFLRATNPDLCLGSPDYK